MTLAIVLITLAVVAWAASKVWQAHKRTEAVLNDEWCDCPVCANALDEAARARLTALFNDTPKGEDRG